MWGLFVASRKATRIRRLQQLAVGCAAAALCSGLLTQAALADGNQQKAPPAVPYDTASWAGLNWGLGLAADFDVGGTRVANASIVNGIVRLNDTSSNVGVSFVLEAHYFLRERPLMSPFAGPGDCSKPAPNNPGSWINCTEVAWGPFIAIEVGGGSTSSPANNGPITGYALGWMVGLHHPYDSSGKPTGNVSWNLGVGLRIDPKAQVLGDGFIANAPPPLGETVIRYKTEPRTGVMLLSSFSF
jgi:hypothetical protein